MADGSFKFEDDLLKHYVRVNGWLPACKYRVSAMRKETGPKKARRLRYFTFCAVGAIDVLMLDVYKILQSGSSGFDTVVFFDKTPEDVDATIQRIPGANGFPGDFVEVVLSGEMLNAPVHLAADSLLAPENESDSKEVWRRQHLHAMRHDFTQCFPFDVINLDLQEFLFKPNDPLPGRVINALRRVFEWQRRELRSSRVGGRPISGFSLMFTTQIGPPDMRADYLAMLRTRLTTNLEENLNLRAILQGRAGTDDVVQLQENSFDMFFKLATPKVLAATLMEEDWHIDPSHGIKIFEFERSSKTRSYRMLHLVMHVCRNSPPRENRAPGQGSDTAIAAYRSVAEQLFSAQEAVVTTQTIDAPMLQASLDKIKARRRKYYPDGG
jgi:hypothetical protein